MTNNTQNEASNAAAGQPAGAAQFQSTQVGVPQHLMGIMSNPTLAAAAAAANPLFSPPAMIANPGAYLAMPDAFAAMAGMQQAPGNAGQQQQQTAAFPNLGAVTVPIQQQQAAAPSNADTVKSVAANNVMGGLMAPGSFPMQQPNHNRTMTMPVQTTSSLVNVAAQKEDSGKKSSGENKRQQTRRADMTPAERAKQNRDRNREHARSTRLRKKAYVQKLKELVEGLHAERTEEVRQRRVAIQHLAEMQNVRRAVVRSFLRFHSSYETDERKWTTILEDDFWLKQPITPYRSFRRAESEQECRISRGVTGMIGDAASLSVMIEGIGSRCSRWTQIKREEFLLLEQSKRGAKKMPRCILRQDSRLQHAFSSLSSSAGYSDQATSGEDSGEKEKKAAEQRAQTNAKLGLDAVHPNGVAATPGCGGASGAKKVSSSSGSGGSSNESSSSRLGVDASNNNTNNKQDFHDYHAKPLPDPKLGEFERSSPSAAEESPEESNSSTNGDNNTKRISADSSSGDDSAAAIAAPRPTKRRKPNSNPSRQGSETATGSRTSFMSRNPLPANIAKRGGIPHNIQPVASAMIAPSVNGNKRLGMAPAVALPPFAGIGKKRASVTPTGVHNPARASVPGTVLNHETKFSTPAVIAADIETSSSSSGSRAPQIRAYYHINEDDMILMDDVLMCPFIFRSQDAVMCGALAECIMPGMLRAHFSSRNKMESVELVYDAMGFMQQLERASGNEGMAQIIPGSLEMALAPCATEARVITLAEPPFLIVNVNELWTRTTGYTQMEVEGKEYLSLLEGEGTVPEAGKRPGKPAHKLEQVGQGRCACSTNIHYDKDGRDFVEFVCSYPLTNANDEITHLLHVSKELPSFQEPLAEPNI